MLLCEATSDFVSSFGQGLLFMDSLPAKGGDSISGAHGALCEAKGKVRSVLGVTCPVIFWRFVIRLGSLLAPLSLGLANGICGSLSLALGGTYGDGMRLVMGEARGSLMSLSA